MLNRTSKTIRSEQIQYDESIGYFFDYRHNVNSDDILVGVFDENGKLMNSNGLYEKLDDNTLRIYFPTNYNITWNVYVFYEDGDILLTAPKKRLFEQDTISAADLNSYLDYRLAMGKEGKPTYNVTIEDFKSWCQQSIDGSIYLLKSNNLSDLNDVAAARNNLDVYSKASVDAIADDLVQASGNVNTVTWTDVAGLNPSVTTDRDFAGVSVALSFSSSSTFTNQQLIQLDLEPYSGITLDVQNQIFPIFAVSGYHTYLGQLEMTVTTSGTHKLCMLTLSLAPGETCDYTAVFHINVNRQ